MNVSSRSLRSPVVLALTVLAGSFAVNSYAFSPETMKAPPSFDDPELVRLQAELTDKHAQITADPERFLTGDARCELSSDGKWLVNFTRLEADMDALHSFRESATGTRTTVQLGETRLVEGECKDGLPDGPFVAVGAYTMTTKTGQFESITDTRTRMEGEAINGMLEGSAYHLMELSFAIAPGQTMTTYFQTAGNYAEGRETGYHFTQMIQPTNMSTWVHEHSHASYGSHMYSRMYMGSELMVEGRSLNGIPHGWSTVYEQSGRVQKNCFELGQPAEAMRCDLQLPPAGLVGSLSDAELAQLVRTDNQGKYLSPYTSDDVLAEWVNSVVVVNIGATMGAVAGAAAGGALAAAADFVPYGLGSLLVAAATAEIGKKVGREAAIAASGGWENIRSNTDRSFDSIDAMARYLASRYGDTATYSEAVRVTADLYPELRGALRKTY